MSNSFCFPSQRLFEDELLGRVKWFKISHMVNELGWVLHERDISASLDVDEGQLRLLLLVAVNLVPIVRLGILVFLLSRLLTLLVLKERLALLLLDFVNLVLGAFH